MERLIDHAIVVGVPRRAALPHASILFRFPGTDIESGELPGNVALVRVPPAIVMRATPLHLGGNATRDGFMPSGRGEGVLGPRTR